MDHYPSELYLLPNNEVQYQRFGPQEVLFFCQSVPEYGGRTFLHSAKDVESGLRASEVGARLIEKMDTLGLMIETGFLDAEHQGRAGIELGLQDQLIDPSAAPVGRVPDLSAGHRASRSVR